MGLVLALTKESKLAIGFASGTVNNAAFVEHDQPIRSEKSTALCYKACIIHILTGATDIVRVSSHDSSTVNTANWASILRTLSHLWQITCVKSNESALYIISHFVWQLYFDTLQSKCIITFTLHLTERTEHKAFTLIL